MYPESLAERSKHMQVSKIKEEVPDAAVTHIDCDLTDFESVKNAAKGSSLTSFQARNPALRCDSADLILVMLTVFSTPCDNLYAELKVKFGAGVNVLCNNAGVMACMCSDKTRGYTIE